MLAVFVLFALAGIINFSYRGNFLAKALFIAMEAALVGGIADWFAVTALFKKPLGLSWHTAIIPRNRAKIIDATAHMVQYEFFSREKLKTRLEKVQLTDHIIRWLETGNGNQVCGIMLARFTQNLADTIEPPVIAAAIEKMVKAYILQLSLTPAVKALGEWVLQNRHDEQFIDYILGEIDKVVRRTETRQAVYDYLEGYKQQKSEGLLARMVVWLGERTNAISIEDAAESFYQQLVALLEELGDRRHPLRTWLRNRLEDLVMQIEGNHAWQQAIEEWKVSMVARVHLQEMLTDMINIAVKSVYESAGDLERVLQDSEFTRRSASGDSGRDIPPLMALLLNTIEKYWPAVKKDREVRLCLEGYAKEAICHIIDCEHHFIGVVVKNALQALSDKELNKLVEAKAGEDLQWIRINGSVVGGITGFIGYLLMQLMEKAWHGLMVVR